MYSPPIRRKSLIIWMNKFLNSFLLIAILYVFVACNQLDIVQNKTDPIMEDRIANDKPIVNLGEDKKSLTELILGDRSESLDYGGSITFQTALDKVSFMPLASVDAASGVIITDWYNIDGDDLRNISKNQDYSKEGRIRNISTAISIMRFLCNKDYICVISIVAPYKFLRDELKDEFPFLEVYLHTSEIRGRESYFAEDYEIPTDPKTLSIDTGKLTIKESKNEILNVYRKMATLA